MFKKIAIFVLTIIMTCTLFACGDSGSENASPESIVYNSVADYSNLQGYNNWYYFYTRGDVEGYQKMVFDVDLLEWSGRDFYSDIKKGEMHPGNNGDSIIAWCVPASGSINVEASFQLATADSYGSGATGIFVYGKVNETEDFFFSQAIEKDDGEKKIFTKTIEVEKDDYVYFTLNANGTNSYDTTNVEINIEYA